MTASLYRFSEAQLPLADVVALSVEWPEMTEDMARAVARHLVPALDYPFCEWRIVELFEAIAAGDMGLLMVHRDLHHIASLVGNIQDDHGEPVLVIVAAGGEGAGEWIVPVFEAGIEQARRWGCERIAFKGRTGWTRAVRGLGFKPVYTAYEYKLEAE